MRKNTKKLIRKMKAIAGDAPDGKLPEKAHDVLQELFPKNYDRVLKFFSPK